MTALDSSAVIAVIGAGTMGAGIAQVAANSGHRVKLYDQNTAAVEKGLSHISTGLEKLVARGRMNAEAVDELLQRIEPCEELSQLSDAKLIVEAIVEDLEIKQSLFQTLEAQTATDTILASNTSSISITAIAAVLKRPENLVGMHFFNPAPVMKLVEVISGLATAETVANTVAATATAWGKKTVLAKSTPGFIVNRIARPFYAESLRLLEEGAASAATLDAVLREAGGFRMGPFQLMDLIGHDVNYSVTESVFNAYFQDQRFLPSLLQKELVAGGYLGRKSGRGFYDYSADAEPPVPATAKSESKPEKITVYGELGVAADLLKLATAAGMEISTEKGPGTIKYNTVTLMLSDGRTATARAAQDNIDNLVVFDLMEDYSSHSRIAIAASLQTSAAALQQAVDFFSVLGKQVSVIADTPGLCLMRIVCMLANEGADAVYQGVCDIPAVDSAMQYGLNYPQGPMAWADSIGLAHVRQVLSHLQQSYGMDRYRTSLLIQQLSDAGRRFYD